MRDPADLYELRSDLPELSSPVLLVSLDGFVDAGAAGKQAVAALFDGLQATELVAFDIDGLLDYRSRRPVMTFDETAWVDYTEPKLSLYLVHDLEGTPFLLLHGLEPDREWEAFTAAVQQLVERLSVGLTVCFYGIPMAVPHTRPVTATPHATRDGLVPDHASWVGRIQVPGNAMSLLEYRLGQAGHDVIGYAVHVPSYLAQSEYPRAGLAVLEYLADTTGLALPTEGLAEEARKTDGEIDRQVESSEEVQRVVRNLEAQYDSFVAADDGVGADALLAGDEADLPTAEELGAELERFLAEHDRGSEG
ncbi:PAC2 family protein [Thermobifida halotolerans]|uniref:PAC2 family protein n=1 Tax=Thermobifida halotolerans TaxID=483545 RepID=A0AA97M4K3_9ACTN|nr:PAC2 family protein [Thermobifida halotolerans]UOE20057.1 PAC2 family protein [Thermobifida halotolerans]